MKLDTSLGSILLIVAVVLFVLSAMNLNFADLSSGALGLAAFAASFLFGKGGINLGR